VVIFGISFLFARRQERKTRSRTEDAAHALLAEEDRP
jgi:hypothetical protein